MRGKGTLRRIRCRGRRITPAYAGKREWYDDVNTKVVGSPPPMRGKAVVAAVLGLRHGITPAYAGKSYRNGGRRCGTEDHPRLCGEKSRNQQNGQAVLGSPPPMRGKATSEIRSQEYRRITPAYAGKSVSAVPEAAACQDHPRLCGEKMGTLMLSSAILGSPPPMRGKAVFGIIVFQAERITPAYAGKRHNAVRWQLLVEDHPRLCGEKF